MRGADDPSKEKPQGTEARPPDPLKAGGKGKEVAERRTTEPPPSQDSVVPETPNSREEEAEEMKEPQPGKTVKLEQDCKGQQQDAKDDGRCVRPEASAGWVKSALHSTEKQEESGTHESDEATAEISPQEMFGAVVAEMKESQQVAPKVAWTTTIAELYARVHDTVRMEEALIPDGKQRYPKLKGEEKAELYKLFRELCVVTEGTYKEWEEYAVAITQKLYNTSWSFKNIVLRMVSKVKWVKTQPLNQWTTKIKSGSLPVGATAQQEKEQCRYEDFMFNPAYFSKPDIESLRELCERPAAAGSGRRLREGTTEEWRIISGIAEGTIVCRRQPDFLKSILDSKECIRLYRTIQRQVEGSSGVRRESTPRGKDILVAGEALHMNTAELGRMLHLTKTISYNHVQRSIHLFFFDRATARKYQLLPIPYNRTIYHLVNVHAPDTGSVWARQLGRDGTRPMPQREYEVHIRNVTRFTDVGRLTAYLQKNIVAAIELEDMDTCTPELTNVDGMEANR